MWVKIEINGQHVQKKSTTSMLKDRNAGMRRLLPGCCHDGDVTEPCCTRFFLLLSGSELTFASWMQTARAACAASRRAGLARNVAEPVSSSLVVFRCLSLTERGLGLAEIGDV